MDSDRGGARRGTAHLTKASRTIRNHLAVARGAGMVVVRVGGTGNMLTAPALNDFAEQQRLAGYRRFVFDLALCRGLDSTFMGCMVGMCSALKREPRDPSDAGPGSSDTLPMYAGRQSRDPESAGEPNGAPEDGDKIESLTPEEALAALREHLAKNREDSQAGTAIEDGFVVAVNVSAECRELMNILGVDKFVRIAERVDLSGIEMAELPEADLPPEERRRLILRAHENLIEIDKRNEAQFGAFLRTLSAELSKESKT